MLEIEEKERIIEEVMDGFDFERVERVMKSLDWCWDIDGNAEVPDISTLKWRAENLLDEVMKQYGKKIHYTSCSCGGMKATLLAGKKLVLEFVVEESISE